MLKPTNLSETSPNKIDVLGKGYVRLVDHMGSDLSVVNAARVSFDKRSDWETVKIPDPTEMEFVVTDPDFPYVQTVQPVYHYEQRLKEGDKKLIQFLARNGHWSPFAHPQLQFEIKCPMLVKNQWIKHRIGMTYLTDEDAEAWDNEGWNEQSMRYVSPTDFYVPPMGAWRAAPANKKQGSGDFLPWTEYGIYSEYLDWDVDRAVKLYKKALDQGVAPEQARLLLPMYAMYTTFYWTTSLYGVARFLQLRTKADSQYEIRQFAEAVEELATPLFPESLSALLTPAGV